MWAVKLGRTTLVPLAFLVVALGVSGCASGSAEDAGAGQGAGPSASRGNQMVDDQKPAPGHPSKSATEICNREIRSAVGRNLDIHPAPSGVSHWDRLSRVYTCEYRVNDTRLLLTVKDLDGAAGDAYYRRLLHQVPGATSIRGELNFGFSAFETPNGRVAFLKDGKTLLVDASHLTTSDRPRQISRQEIAYGVASSVIGCWTE
jgi:hypothetical protein